jgi:hypothetical protein
LGENLIVPPVNIGPRTTPNYDTLIGDAIYTLEGGVKVFAGQRDDPFFVDLGAIFDLLAIRAAPGNAGQGRDDLAGYNVQAIVLEVPIEALTSNNTNPTDPLDPAAVLGLWSTTRSCKHELVAGRDGGLSEEELSDFSVFARKGFQVSRLGMPLVNEVVIPIRFKDRWNASNPRGDAQFLPYVVDPELAVLLESLYGVTRPAPPRCDLVSIFLTGIEGLNQPLNVVPSEQMRLNVAIKHDENPDSRLGVLGGDFDGFPNGRRLTDDVVDIAEQVVAGRLYPKFCDPAFIPHELASVLGDGVDQNDQLFLETFPYLASPNQGFEHEHHRIEPPHSAERSRTPHRIGAFTGGSEAAVGTAVREASRFELASPNPNPAGAGSEISFSLAEPSRVQLRIFDVAGREVRTLVDGELPAGSHQASWDGADGAGHPVAAGVYMVQLSSPGEKANRKLAVVR